MSIVEMYYYFFYKVYNLMEYVEAKASGNRFRAITLMALLETVFILSFYNFYDVFFKQKTSIQLISFKSIPFIVIILSKLIAFEKDDKWINYVKNFNEWPRAKNTKGLYIVIGVVILILISFVLSWQL